jgi:transposase
MRLHLQAISQAVPDGRHALLIVDGALWHNAKAGQGIGNLTLLKLPPASPELNPIEQVWQYLRQHKLANRCFENYEAIVDACCEAWNWFEAQPGKVTELTRRGWASVEL